MEVKYTLDQEKVINLRNRNILVAAAAGSGKTAVLSERIVNMVSNEKDKIDIDRLLIVTFTKAAAAEMRERISNKLLDKLDQEPDNEHLKKQVTLIHNAQITTIDSFCMFVLRNNFNEIGLDPGFRVGDEGELRLLRQEVLETLLEKHFSEKSQEFVYCVEYFATNGKENKLEDIMNTLYDFSQSYPWPEEWLDLCQETYAPETVAEWEKSEFYQYADNYKKTIISGCIRKLQDVKHLCEEPDGPYMYMPMVETDLRLLEDLNDTCNMNEYYEKITKIAFPSLSSKRDDSVSQKVRELAKDEIASVKKNLDDIKSLFFFDAPLRMLEEIKKSDRAVSELLSLVKEYAILFREKKQDKGIVDFSDMEHYALSILLNKDGEKVVPTKAARAYRDYFYEILVDEYQDSNWVQEYLLKSISGEDINLYKRFMVGDVKQSIYRFRMARPDIFTQKYNSYDVSDNKTQRVDLHINFRSRKSVLDTCNYIFSRVMHEDVGGVLYDEAASLSLGAEFPFYRDDYSELLIAEADSKGKKETEAVLIANRIHELVGNHMVFDAKQGKMRACTYRDIVILLRSDSGWEDALYNTLTDENIPIYVTTKTGFFSTFEIQFILNFLRVLDNPLQDIPLSGALLSPVFGFSEEDLAEIKISIQEKTDGKTRKKLFNQLSEYVKQPERQELGSKMERFLLLVNTYRDKISYLPIHQLIQRFVEELGVHDFLRTMPDGEKRVANVDMLIEKAIHFESTSYHGLFHFIRYIEQLEKYKVDFGEEILLDENAVVVRVMSIHKSKGLQFPICILAGSNKQFNMKDARKSFIIEGDLGVASEYVDLERRVKKSTFRKNTLATKLQIDTIGEELRILYVAMTRAQEKVIVTATVASLEKLFEKIACRNLQSEQVISFPQKLSCKSFFEILLMAFSCHPSLAKEWYEGYDEKCSFLRVATFSEKQLEKVKVVESISKGLLKKTLQLRAKNEVGDRQWNELLEKRLSFVYPHSILSKLYTKTTISELKMAAMEEEGVAELFTETTQSSYIPNFVREKEKVSGTTRGNAFHRTLEILPFEKPLNTKEVEEELKKKKEMGRITTELYEAVVFDKIASFFSSTLSSRMITAQENNMLFREQPFVIAIPAKQLNEEFPEMEKVLIQGIIDAYFEENDELVVVDYKTDRVTKEEELITRYRVQLDYYAEALERLTGKKVKEKIIYSFSLGKEVQI